jgi:hypothetical protein
VDFRVKVLTTQHQNNLFLIHVVLEGSGEMLEVYSNPIKSVSKPEQIRRRISEQQVKEVPEKASKKRVRGEELLTTLEDMRLVQQQQSALLSMILTNQQRLPVLAPAPVVPSLEEALALLVRACEAEASLERPSKIRKTTLSFPSRDQLLLAEIGGALVSSSMLPPTPTPAVSSPQSPFPSPATLTPYDPSFDSSDFDLELECSQSPCSSPEGDSFFDSSCCTQPIPAPTDFLTSTGSPFDLASLGVDVTGLTAEQLTFLGDNLCTWIGDY